MSQKLKSQMDDLRKVSDEKFDAVERSSAIARLRFDGVQDIESVLVKLLRHKSFLLRRDAIVTLVGFWHKPDFLNEAFRILQSDVDESVRSGAAFALGEFAAQTGNERSQIINKLIKHLMKETQHPVQEECYKAVLRIVAPVKMPRTVATNFNRERDVDWNLLRPYMN
ncbi:MAG: HEAT repeat domain-containing protein [Pyrinomonadaceae bacterium]|nr:HEAT repeat domain-containing protein [Pyrinomonadaceae bacterium]